MPCGSMRMSPGAITAGAVPLAQLATVLSRTLGRSVVDKTGLTAKFNISLEFAPEDAQRMRLPPDAPLPPSSDGTAPSIFTALQEQLGLKLESQKGPVEILVVERAEKPSEN